MKSEKVQARVQEHYDYVSKLYNNRILGVFLYGSQNYNLHNEESDVDTKAIYIPTLRELTFNQPVSVEHRMPNGEHCEVKDIREIVKNFKKQNINFVEILFTEYFVLNDKYKDVWNSFFIEEREKIARYDIHQAICSMSHQSLHTLKQASNNLEETGKKVSNAARLLYFIERYLRGEDYQSCIEPKGKAHELLMEMKFDDYPLPAFYFTIETLRMSLDGYAKADYRHLVDATDKKRLDVLMEEATLKLIRLNF